jgi:hypothetical protein
MLHGAARCKGVQPPGTPLRHFSAGRPVAAELVGIPKDGLGCRQYAQEVRVLFVRAAPAVTSSTSASTSVVPVARVVPAWLSATARKEEMAAGICALRVWRQLVG